MKPLHILLIIVLSFAVAFATAKFAVSPKENLEGTIKDSVYDRVIH
jgi:hypothetical protein